METTIARWGHSLGLRIPKGVAGDAGLEVGDAVSIESSPAGLIVRKVRQKSKYDLAELLSRITSENPYSATDWGGPKGREVW